jgi:hypothetical protein
VIITSLLKAIQKFFAKTAIPPLLG